MTLQKTFLNLPAPAKINRFLHVIGRRADGYHLLESVFELMDLHDSIDFAERNDGRIVRSGDMSGNPSDLCVRAAHLLRDKTGCSKGAEITVRKRIPVGAGLGGGSTDAATALIALNRLWNLNLSREELAEAGAELGADIPFFIRGENAFVEGIGEKNTPLQLPEKWFAIVWPGVFSSTENVFKSPDLTRNTQSLKISGPHDTRQLEIMPEDFGKNDLEPVVRSRVPAVNEAIEWLSRSAPARMTGSGSAVFAVFASQASAESALAGIPQEWRGFAVKNLPRHPLSAWLDG